MAQKSAFEYRLQDPLSEVTRKERRALLAASTVTIVVTKTGLIPSKIEALGISFSPGDQHSLLLVLGAVVLYFLVAFITYGLSDFLAWKLAFNVSIRDRMERDFLAKKKNKDLDEKLRDVFLRNSRTLLAAVRPISFLRTVFEFVVPIAIAVFALAYVLNQSGRVGT
jgi:hypothetical protein